MGQNMGDPFSEQERTRTASLAILIDLLRGFREDATRKDFSNLFSRAQLVLELDDPALAQMFRVSRPTIGRWARGDSAPHPIGRKAVLESLVDVARAKLKHHKGEAAQRAMTAEPV
jgi:hypothetical protein